MLSTALYQ